jgi:probable rRNA maturation factor
VRKSQHLEVTRRARIWSPPAGELSTWARAALGRRARGAELALRVVGTTESRRLNAHYRGKDAPTNVLSFPAQPLPAPLKGAVRPLGDLVICARVLRREARDQGKSLRAHWAHLVVHGALHLIGYDHERARDARRMERREITVLRSLGFANPYRSA